MHACVWVILAAQIITKGVDTQHIFMSLHLLCIIYVYNFLSLSFNAHSQIYSEPQIKGLHI